MKAALPPQGPGTAQNGRLGRCRVVLVAVAFVAVAAFGADVAAFALGAADAGGAAFAASPFAHAACSPAVGGVDKVADIAGFY